MNKSYVILVDRKDNEMGIMEKMEAHSNAILHRAISVFICNSNGEWLLQKRSLNKYHSGGLWTNASCTHPLYGETNTEAAKRRLIEEMGLKCNLCELFSFIYLEKLDNELTEHELDHVFLGITDEKPIINTDEVMEWKYIAYNDLKDEIKRNPSNYTVWFKKIVDKVNNHIKDFQTEKV